MLLSFIAAFIAYFVKGLCGFANTLIYTSFMAFGSSNRDITPVELILGLPSNIIMVWKERRSLKARVCLPLMALVLAGCIPGAFLLKQVDAHSIKIVCGIVITLLGLQMLLTSGSVRKTKQSPVLTAVIGLLSGVCCGLFGIGAMLSAYMGRIEGDSHFFKANLCAVFLMENIFRIILYSCWGVLTVDILRQAAMLLPAMGLGLAAGMLAGHRLREDRVKRAIMVMLVISGVALIINSLM